MFSSAFKSFSSNISSNYSLSQQPTSAAGPWKIFDAKHKSSGKAVSVFVFDKKTLEPQGGGLGARSSDRSLKRTHEEVLVRLKKEGSSLARLRHPSILELAEPVEDTRNGGLMFATEAVTASLAGLLADKDDQERAGGIGGRGSRYVIEEADGTRRRRELEIDELEIQKGLLQLAKGLEFLHESASLVHCNLTPEAIFINAKGDWKISGLGFSSPPENVTSNTTVTPIALSEALNYDARVPRSVQLSLDYTSPDFVMDNNVTTAADMFSLGLIVISLYNSPHKSPLETNGSTSTYKRIFSTPSNVPTQNNNFLSSKPIPKDATSSLLPKLITRRPAQRYSAREMQQAQYFDNILISTIRFLESLPAKTPHEKTQFLRGLPRILNQFPKSVLEKKILPSLLDEMKDKELLALVLQNVFKMMPMMPNGKRAFLEQVIPKLRETFLVVAKKGAAAPEKDTLKDAGLMVLLENMQVVAENTTGKGFKDDILPIIQLAMESPTHSVVDASLKTLPAMLPVLDFSTIKNEVFPVIAAVFSKTSSMGIKIRGLEAFRTLCGGDSPSSEPIDDLNGLPTTQKSKPHPGQMLHNSILDKYTIQEKMIPLLKVIKTKEPAVMMAALSVFSAIGAVVDTDFLAMDVLPILWTFSLGPLLNLAQFQAFMTLIKSLSTRIENEQTRKLQELNASAASPASHRSEFASLNAGTGASANGFDAANGADDFESLVSGRRGAAEKDILDDQWGAATTALPSRPTQGNKPQPAPAFSWSSPAAAPVQAQRQTTLQQPLAPTSRTVTPDHTLTSFAALQPSNVGGFAPPPAQHSYASTGNGTNMGMGMGMGMSVLSPTSSTLSPTPAPSTAPQSTSINWSAAQNPPNMWSAPVPTSQTQSRPIASTQSFGIAPPPASPYSAFGIAPPPAGRQGSYGNGLGGVQGQKQGGQGREKSGMDKYESLL